MTETIFVPDSSSPVGTQGVPARIVIGPRDLAAGVVELARRDNLTKESVPQEGLAERLLALMADIQENIYAKALKFRGKYI